MPLTLVSVPIGNPGDITLRALETLKSSDYFIGEERKPMFRMLKELGVDTPEQWALLNEHSSQRDVLELVEICRHHQTSLVTDCGTPGFSDPGSQLVAACRKNNIEVTAAPGASSLTTFISLCGLHLKSFHFEGFLPRESSERIEKIKTLGRFKIPVILMDTPYRLKKTLEQMAGILPNKQYVVGMDFTKESELVLSGNIQQILKAYDGSKKEFLLLIH